MTLRPCYRATCDAPRCRASEMIPHDRTAAVRAQLRAMGWVVLRHRVARAGIVRRSLLGLPRDTLVPVADTGGSGCLLYCCPFHAKWRPRGGVILSVDNVRTEE